MLPDEQTDPRQFEVFRKMSPGNRLELAERLGWDARELKAAGLRAQHPEWPEGRVQQEVRQVFLHART